VVLRSFTIREFEEAEIGLFDRGCARLKAGLSPALQEGITYALCHAA
jgi:hypothetical protein